MKRKILEKSRNAVINKTLAVQPFLKFESMSLKRDENLKV